MNSGWHTPVEYSCRKDADNITEREQWHYKDADDIRERERERNLHTLGRMKLNNIWAASAAPLLQRKRRAEAWLMGTLPLPQGGFSDWQLPTVHIHPEKKKSSKHTITSIMEALGYCDPEKKRANLSSRRCKMSQTLSFIWIWSMSCQGKQCRLETHKTIKTQLTGQHILQFG